MPQGQPGRFACTFDGCERSFGRQEHLQRHVLNHTEGDHTCERCRTVFKRPDLLDRHLARHKQKDAEGSTLMTRKRLYKDSEGRVVNKRPAKARNQSESTEQQTQAFLTSEFPLSPPGSASGPSNSSTSGENLNNPFSIQATEPTCHQTSLLEGFGDEVFSWDETLPSVYETNNYSNGPFDDIFMPDTASSFNMPYTTMNNYTWLFDLSLDPALSTKDTMGLKGAWSASIDQNYQQPIQSTKSPHQSLLNEPTQNQGLPRSPGLQRTAQREGHPHSEPESTASGDSRAYPSLINSEHPMAFIDPNPKLPVLDDPTYDRLLELIELARPTMPDGGLIAMEHPLISLPSLRSYLDLFFTRFNVAYPLIHMATFPPSETEPLLLISMILLGATYADKDAHQLAVCIHDVLRPQIFSNPGFSAKPELWVLQTILLTECFGKSRGGQKQHDMSHLFHGLLINLIRRSDCQTVTPETMITAESDDAESHWRRWADLEQKKRLAQLCFVWDVQHAVLFSQSLCMSAFELRSTLPCHQRLWEASSADEWQSLSKEPRLPPPHLLSVLKLYLKSETSARSMELNALSRTIVLHGLMSISWDMTRRDQTSLGMVGNGITSGSWRARMSKAYDGWKAHFDVYTRRPKAPGTGDDQRYVASFQEYTVANNAIYNAAQLILAAEILDLQIYAGARHILGRAVSRVDYTRSQKNVKSWANVDVNNSARATWHAAHILQEAVTLGEKSSSFVIGDLFHHPWTLFLANVTIWSFFHSRPASSTDGDDEIIWDPKADMSNFLAAILEHTPEDLASSNAFGKTCTAGLTSVVVNNISKIRWGVVHDGMLVLKGLVPWRLINEDVEVA